jgi:hypothetical protein
MLEQVHTILDQLEQKERLSLLELAIWKAQCLLDMPFKTEYVETLQWHSDKWKSNKLKHHGSNTGAIIVAAVLPFQRVRHLPYTGPVDYTQYAMCNKGLAEILQCIRFACPELLSLNENTSTLNSSSSIVARSQTLGLEAWRDKVQASIFRCRAYDRLSMEDNAPTTQQQRLERVHAILGRLEQKERLSLLELAIWKALCLLDMPAMTDYMEARQWHTYKWQSNKSKYQRSNASAVIVAAVLLFL